MGGAVPRAFRDRRVLTPGHRLLAVALTALLLVVQTAAVRHEVSILHVVCVEHGEVLDIPVVSNQLGAGAIPQIREVAALAARGAEHAHCGFAAVTHATTRPCNSRVGAWLATSLLSQSSLPAAPPAAIPPLLLAPKTSPPGAPRHFA
jgi:hypothetical protein